MLEPYNDVNEFYIEVEVKNPKVENGSYVSYEIAIETNNFSFTETKSSVRRRYSEFVLLRKLLMKEFPVRKLPPLPPKFPFKDHFSAAFIENRRKGLEEFVKKIVSESILLSSKALHLFLQSSHTMPEIRDIIQKKNLPAESNENGSINGRLPSSAYSSLADDFSTLSLSSHTDADASANSHPAETPASISTSKTDSSHPSGESKRVSFCDQVTVAHVFVG